MDWQRITVHHTASPVAVRRGSQMVPVDAAVIREWHLTRGWSDIGYHFIILPDGGCEAGRPLHRPGAHCAAGSRNFTSIGVCMVGNFSEHEVPEVQFEGLLIQVTALMEAFKIPPENVELHREVPGAATECPGRLFPADIFRQRLRGDIGGPVA